MPGSTPFKTYAYRGQPASTSVFLQLCLSRRSPISGYAPGCRVFEHQRLRFLSVQRQLCKTSVRTVYGLGTRDRSSRRDYQVQRASRWLLVQHGPQHEGTAGVGWVDILLRIQLHPGSSIGAWRVHSSAQDLPSEGEYGLRTDGSPPRSQDPGLRHLSRCPLGTSALMPGWDGTHGCSTLDT